VTQHPANQHLAANLALVHSAPIPHRIYSYTHAPGVTVFDRLTADAMVRRTVPRQWGYNDPEAPANGGRRFGDTG
jgi:hypothetical protein